MGRWYLGMKRTPVNTIEVPAFVGEGGDFLGSRG